MHHAGSEHPTRDDVQAALVSENMGLARLWARRYASALPHLSQADLMDLAREGLQDAARRWDPQRGATFGTVGSWWIRARLHREMGRLFPPQTLRLLYRVHCAERTLAQQLSRTPTVEELADHLGLQTTRVRHLTSLRAQTYAVARAARLDQPLTPGSATTLESVVQAADPPARPTRRVDDLRLILAQRALPQRHEKLIREMAALPESMDLLEREQAVARKWGLPVEDVHHELLTILSHHDPESSSDAQP